MELYFVFFLFAHLLQVLYAIAPDVVITPKNKIALVGEDLVVKCNVKGKPSYCRVVFPDGSAVSLWPGTPPHDGIRYTGEGLEKGDCGVLIQRVKYEHDGVIKCIMGFQMEATESIGSMTLTVAKDPDPPILKVVSQNKYYPDSFREGEVYTVNCRINSGRPPANISWYLGSELITEGIGPRMVEKRDGVYDVSQNLTRKAHYHEHGKDLKCVAGHMAFRPGQINHSIYKLNIRFPPKPKSHELERFGFTIGQPGKIVVTFQANPIPDIVWKVGQNSLNQGTRDKTARFEASVLQSKGFGTWDAILLINQVREEEVEKRYTLTARNELGQESYNVAISTNQEPPEGFTTVAVTGIVILVLLILLAAFVLIFARTTGRWCFEAEPRIASETLLPYRWPRNSGGTNPKKVNSLVYKNYTLVQFKDGTKFYVSPEEKSQLLVEGKIQAEAVSGDGKTKPTEPEADDSDSGYEVPIRWKGKPKSCEDLDRPPRPEMKRNSSFPFSDWEAPGDNERINLPPYIVPVETSLTLPTAKRKNKSKKRKDSDLEKNSENLLRNLNDNGVDFPAEIRVEENEDEVESRKAKSSMSFWGRKKKEDKEQNPSRNRFTVPWTKHKEKSGREEEEKGDENLEFPAGNGPKPLLLKLPRLSWTKNKKETTKNVEEAEEKDKEGVESELPSDDEEVDKPETVPDKSGRFFSKMRKLSLKRGKNDKTGSAEESEKEDSTGEEKKGKKDFEDEKEGQEKPETLAIDKPKRFSFKMPKLSLSGSGREKTEMAQEPEKEEERSEENLNREPLNAVHPEVIRRYIRDVEVEPYKLERPEEIFPVEEVETEKGVQRKAYRFSVPHFPDEILKATEKRARARGKVDRNPLKNMFGAKKWKPAEEATGAGEVEEKEPKRESDVEEPSEFLAKRTEEEEEKVEEEEEGEIGREGKIEAGGAGEGSDTESADHGTNKSSMATLTSGKPTGSFAGRVFDIFRTKKTGRKVAENGDYGIPKDSLPTVEILPEKQQLEEPSLEATKTDGIVYAELDMARSPSNVMRREDEKTEYAEIIYPGTRMSPERTMEELRKSRENLSSSRENLTEVDEALSTTTAPEGRKEAAV